MQGVLSTLNSTTTLLAAGADFTGTFEFCQHYTELLVSLYTVQPGTNLRINWSHDGSTVWDTEVLGSVTARASGSMVTFAVSVKAAYFRVSYSNGAGNQTAMGIQTIMKYTGSYATLGVPKLGKIDYRGEIYELKMAYVNAATGPATYSIISAVPNKVIRMLHVNLTVAIAGTVQWLISASQIVPAQAYAANGQIIYRGSSHNFWGFDTASPNAAISIATTGASQIVRGSVSYIESSN